MLTTVPSECECGVPSDKMYCVEDRECYVCGSCLDRAALARAILSAAEDERWGKRGATTPSTRRSRVPRH